MAELSRIGGAIDPSTAARAIVLAVVSNTLVKGAIVLSMGSATLVRAILPGMPATLVTAVGVVCMFVTTVMSCAHRGACHRGPIVRSL